MIFASSNPEIFGAQLKWLEMNPGDKSDFILKQSENVKQFPVFEL
jgi:hypothetical protein